MREVSGNAYAKVNFTLDILDRRPDGYHDIRSIMQTIDLCDRLKIRRGAGDPGVRLTVTGPLREAAPAGESNLVCRAVRAVMREAGLDENGESIDIELSKRIPSQAGLGGGSSDAATAIKLMVQIFRLDLPDDTLVRIAHKLGSDVPFFLTGGTCLVEGLGEKVTPIASRLTTIEGRRHLVLCKPSASVPTAMAYQELDRLRRSNTISHGNATDKWLAAFESGGVLPLSNDFEPVILRMFPVIAHVRLLMGELSVRVNASTPLLSGSGSAQFCIFDTGEGAVAMAQALSQVPDFKIEWVAAASTCGGDAA